MLATLLLVALGPWTYSGLISNPKPPVAPVPPAPRPAIVRPAEAPAPPPPAPLAVKQVASPPPPAPPTVWRLADATGQVWEHADPAALSAFVRQRNAQLTAPRYFAPAPAYRASRCGPSGCR